MVLGSVILRANIVGKENFILKMFIFGPVSVLLPNLRTFFMKWMLLRNCIKNKSFPLEQFPGTGNPLTVINDIFEITLLTYLTFYAQCIIKCTLYKRFREWAQLMNPSWLKPLKRWNQVANGGFNLQWYYISKTIAIEMSKLFDCEWFIYSKYSIQIWQANFV